MPTTDAAAAVNREALLARALEECATVAEAVQLVERCAAWLIGADAYRITGTVAPVKFELPGADLSGGDAGHRSTPSPAAALPAPSTRPARAEGLAPAAGISAKPDTPAKKNCELPALDLQILSALRASPRGRLSDLAVALNADKPSLKAALRRLLAQRSVTVQGHAKAARWSLTP